MELRKLAELANNFDELARLMRDGIRLYLEEHGDVIISDDELEEMMENGNDVRVTISDEDGEGRTITIQGVRLDKSYSYGYDIVVKTDEGDEVDGYGCEIYYWIIQFFKRVETLRKED